MKKIIYILLFVLVSSPAICQFGHGFGVPVTTDTTNASKENYNFWNYNNDIWIGVNGTHLNRLLKDYGTYSLLPNYWNFGTTGGESGFGIRNNSGDVEFKDSGGSWVSIPSATSDESWTRTGTIIGKTNGGDDLDFGAANIYDAAFLSNPTDRTSYYFDGTNDYVDFGALAIGTIHSMLADVYLSSDHGTFSCVIGNSSGGGYIFTATATKIYYNDGASAVSVNYTFPTDQWVKVGICRENTSVSFYAEGEQVGSTQTLPANNSITVQFVGKRFSADNMYWAGNISNVSLHNRCISSAEMLVIYNDKPLEFKYYEATNTMVASYDSSGVDDLDITLVADKYYYWNSGNADSLMIGATKIISDTSFTYTSGLVRAKGDLTGSYLVTSGQILALMPDAISADKWYDNSGNDYHGTVSGATVTNPVLYGDMEIKGKFKTIFETQASDNFQIGCPNTGGYTFVHWYNDGTGSTTSDGWFTGINDAEDFVIYSNESAEDFRIYNNGAYRFDVQSDGDIIHGAGGGDATNSYANSYIYTDNTVTGETTLTNVLPVGYIIDSIIFKNTTANAITDFDIGFTDGGGEIVATGNVTASDEGSFTINQKIDDFDAADTIYISANTWNSANLIIHIKMMKIF